MRSLFSTDCKRQQVYFVHASHVKKRKVVDSWREYTHAEVLFINWWGENQVESRNIPSTSQMKLLVLGVALNVR